MNAATTIHFAPILPDPVLYVLAGITIILFLASVKFYKRGMFWRAICAAAFMTLFLNPSIIQEERESVTDVVAIVTDMSPSQSYGKRTERTETALDHILKQLDYHKERIEVRTVEAPAGNNKLARDTRLFEALNQTMADVPLKRRAGVILLTDGQVHDAPSNPEQFSDFGPIHTLLSGEKDEKDRQIVVIEAPAYGIVGQSVTMRYMIEDTNTNAGEATLIVRQDGQSARTFRVPVNKEQTMNVKVSHAGQNIVDMEAAPLEGEITQANNRAPLIVNGVRDRLRVLLVSGQPHAGGRTWRNILTSDPGVDLVHFTILREPNKLDATPQNELSLIAFPFRELFEIKLYDFDLIIFDRYKLNRILPNYYFANIAKYVREGGALLEASGPAFATNDSVYTTDLKDVLPAYPTGNVLNVSYRPEVTEIGSRHPVTQGLTWYNDEWGDWLRQISVQPLSGNTVMQGANNLPLLILDRVGKGRIAQLASDQIWLWARGYDGGGPQAELIRRMAHWLMKEPELEENALDLQVDGSTIRITRRSLENVAMPAKIMTPSGNVSDIELAPGSNGVLEARYEADELGIYTVDDGTQKRFAIVGDLNPPELRGVRTTEEILSPLAETTKGGMIWLEDVPQPSVKPVSGGRNFAGNSWVGMRMNDSYNVTGVRDIPFMPPWFYALALIIIVVSAWWFEGRSGEQKQKS